MGWRSRILEEQTYLKSITAAGSRYLPAGVAARGLAADSDVAGLLGSGGSEEGVAEGVETGAVSATTGAAGARAGSANGVVAGTGTTTRVRGR